MKIITKIIIFCLNIVYIPFKMQTRKNKITFISRQSDNVSLDFKLIEEGIKKQNCNLETVFLCKKMGKNFAGKIAYAGHMIAQMRHIGSSKIIVIDGYCILASVLKHKEGLEIIQIWHSLGAVKEFGYLAIGKEEGSSNDLAYGMKMHNGYTKALVSSKALMPIFAKAYNCSEDILEVNPLPVVDILRDLDYIEAEKEKIKLDFPKYFDDGKVNVIYAPTFRSTEEDLLGLKMLIDEIDLTRYNLLVKLHPSIEVPKGISEEGVLIEKAYSTQSMMMAADVVISDYSAIVYEAGILKKPIVLFAYDLENYKKTRGLTVDYVNDMPGPVVLEAKVINEGIAKATDSYYREKQRKFTEKYIELTDEKQSEKIGKSIVQLLEKK